MSVPDHAFTNDAHERPSVADRTTQSDTADIFVRFTSGTVQVREALDKTRDDMRDADVDPATCDTAQIILGEVLNNVVEHAYLLEEGLPIELLIRVTSDGLLCMIKDQGAPMPNGVPPAGVVMDVDAVSREDLPEGGFGWAMVRELTQDLQYYRTESVNELVFLIPVPRP